QAEDGIRYRNVTGVQTCALPISTRSTSLVVGVTDEPPFVIADEHGNGYHGLAIDLWQQTAREHGWSYTYKPYDLKGLLDAVSRRSEERRVGQERGARCGARHDTT